MERDQGMKGDNRNVPNGGNKGFPEVFKKHDSDLINSSESLLWEAWGSRRPGDKIRREDKLSEDFCG